MYMVFPFFEAIKDLLVYQVLCGGDLARGCCTDGGELEMFLFIFMVKLLCEDRINFDVDYDVLY
jgi:hypothetical protein